MKKVLLSTVALIAFAAPAAAADLAARPYIKAPPAPIAVVYDWSGFYIGANGGWGSSHKCWDFTTPAGTFVAAEGCHDATGGTVGGQIGYRWQASSWVFGLEAQGNWADFRGSNVSLIDPTLRNHSTHRCVRPVHRPGRLGRQQRSVLHQGWRGRYGGSFPPFDVPAPAFVVATTGDDTRWGAVVGAGLEFGFAPNWSAGIEYNHLFMQDRTHTFVDTTGAFFGTDRIRQDVDLVTVRVNYRWGGPVIAKY